MIKPYPCDRSRASRTTKTARSRRPALRRFAGGDGGREPSGIRTPGTTCRSLLRLTRQLNIRVELPGVAADQIKIGLCNTKLRIWGEKKRRPARRQNHLSSYAQNGATASLIDLCLFGGRSMFARRRRSWKMAVLNIRLPKLDDRRGGESLVEGV